MPLAHIVYFRLHDRSATAVNALVDGCKQYLKNHPGVTFFAVGTLNPDLARAVNDRDYDVSLHVYFDGREAHDVYQTAADHLKFIAEFKDNWAQVRVFDSDLQ